jgi:DNA-binding NtrC family response regulator
LATAQPAILLLENLQALSPELRSMLYRAIRREQSQQTRSGSRRLIATAGLGAGEADAPGLSQRQLQFPTESFVFHLPALRERMEDVPFIADLLLTQARQRHGKPVFGVDTQAMRCLMAYAWPGNIRELREVIEQAVMICGTIRLGVQDLPGYLQHVRPTPVDRMRLH